MSENPACEQVNDGVVPALLSIWPQAAKVLGLSRAACFRAAARGDLPIMPLGARRRVVTAKLAEKIGRPITMADIT